MGNVVATEFVSLDGVFEDPGGAEGSRHGPWTLQFDRGRDGDQFKLDELKAAEAQLLGRVTYDVFAAAWPSRQDEAGFAELMNGMPKYVVSTTLRDPEWNNSTVISGNVPEEVAALKERTTGDILIAGSGQLVRTLTRHKLVDEYRLMVFPVILGSGKRLFGDDGGDLTRLTLAESRQVGSDGVLVLTYRRAPSD